MFLFCTIQIWCFNFRFLQHVSDGFGQHVQSIPGMCYDTFVEPPTAVPFFDLSLMHSALPVDEAYAHVRPQVEVTKTSL
jgi:hypothetical protein